MSQYRTYCKLNEIQIDDNDDFIAEYETDLPHNDFIIKETCKSFNDMKLERFLDEPLKSNIVSIRMSPRKENYVNITILGKPGFRFTEKQKSLLDDYMSAQFCDGWGEGFFGPINVMTAPDGTKLYVE